MPKTKPNASNGKLNLDPSRLLATPLNSKLLDFNLDVDLYARNGFRFIAVPANADETALERAVQQFRNRFSLAPALATKKLIRLGYDRYAKLDDEDVRESVGHLGNPRQRIVDELFWPHLADDVFRPLAESRVLTPLPELEQMAAGDNLDGVLARHALAVMHHSLALAQELKFAAGRGDSAAPYWATALGYWSGVINDGRFWSYLRQRVEDFDDPRLKPDEVTLLHSQLPGVILSFHALFAETYDQAGAEACVEHIRLVAQCGLPEEAKQAAFQSLAKVFADNRLGPLKRQAEELLGVADRSLNRRSFDQRCAPIIKAANEIPIFLSNSLGLPPNAVATCRFDSLSSKMLDAINLKIDYDTDDRPFSFLYCSLLTKRLLDWPLSPEMRQRIEHNRRSDSEYLYGDFLPGGLDLTECWFIPGQEASLETSLVFWVNKITDVEEDYFQRETKWRTRGILIPRSQVACNLHQEKEEAFISGCLGALAGVIGGSGVALIISNLTGVYEASLWIALVMAGGLALGIKGSVKLSARSCANTARKLGVSEDSLALLKPLAAQHDFPPYRKAKSDGYQDGTTPSDEAKESFALNKRYGRIR